MELGKRCKFLESKDLNMTIKMGAKSFKGIELLAQGMQIDESQIEELCQFVDARYDCADFRVVTLIKTLYAYKHLLSKQMQSRIKSCLLNFKYWMDEPGDDSLCFWSENHQLLFHTCEFLVGQFWPNEIFTNNKMSGINHQNKAKTKLLQWLEHKWLYGFIEWHSNTYYEEDIAPLTLLIDYADDEEIANKATIVLDLLLLDLALYSYDGYYSSTSGRCYENQKKDGNKQDTLEIYKAAFDETYTTFDYERISSVFILREKYTVPDVIKTIAHEKSIGVIKDSMGLHLNEVKNEMNIKDVDTAGAYLWQMEAFTNVESIQMTMKMFNLFNMKKNIFLKDLQQIDHPILRKLHLLPLLVKILNPSTQGVAIQRSNNYTYKVEEFMLSTSMRYHPGEFGDQQHIWHAALPENIHVFSTHPGAPFFDDNARNFSPSYWVGSGILPDSIQEKNIHISLYKIDARKGFLERERLQFTHVFFPKNKFDEVVIEPKRVFGRINETYIQIMGYHDIYFKNEEEIIQEGHLTAWVCEVSSKRQVGDFDTFMQLCKAHQCMLTGLTFMYKNLTLTYKKDYLVDGQRIDTEYKRLESPFATVERKPKHIEVKLDNQKLSLDFDQWKRRE